MAVIIARFSTLKALTYTIGWITACAVGTAATLYHPDGTTLWDYLDSKGPYRSEIVIVAWLAMALLLLRQLAILEQIVLHGGRGIWIARSRLYYMNVFSNVVFRSVKCGDVESIEVATRGGGANRREGIAISLRNGAERFISTWIFAEPADTVLQQMKHALWH